MRVLLFAEAVTLAHLARPLALAAGVASAGHDLSIACDERYAGFVAATPWPRVELHSLPSRQFTDALARGAPVYDAATLEAYVAEDRALIEHLRPDVVVGDFRLSLSVSARLAHVPYLAIANAYWSPHFAGRGFALPVLPMTRRLPLPLADTLFTLARPLAFALHARPLNQVRRRHGLPALGHDLRRVYTDADHLLLADDLGLYPVDAPPGSVTEVGPLTWSPPGALPDWWSTLDRDAATVYVTLGSSGPPAMLATVLEALAPLPLQAMASSAGAGWSQPLPANARLAPYLPGDAAAARSRFVVCNGGSLSVQQALAAGVPVLGLASNMDQMLNMAPIVAAGAGLMLRTDRADAVGIRSAAQRLLAEPAFAHAARALMPRLQPRPDLASRFDAAVAAARAAAGGTQK